MSDLLPCPFCGTTLGIQHAPTCWLSLMWGETTADARHIAWNTRHIDPATKAQIEADVLRSVADKTIGSLSRRRLQKEADRILKEVQK